ncbi:MAG: sulfite exporter TauE/SafE family protein [Bacteroidota bacterium]
MDIIQSFTLGNQLLVVLGAFIIGLAKGGLKGIELLNVTIMALVFGGKLSTGIILPMLCIGDLLAVIYYQRNVKWPLFWKLIIWMALGIIIGVYIGQGMAEIMFKKLLSFIIIVIVIMMIWVETRKNDFLPKSSFFSPIIGLIAGITTMIGNLAGPFSNLFFMAQKVSKNDFIGTAAWVFLAINIFKLPFQIIYWDNINVNTLSLNVLLLPALIAGFYTGTFLVKKIKDESYRKVIIGLTLVGALVIFLK